MPAGLGGLPGEFWWLWLGTFVNRVGTFVVPFLALYVTQGRGLDEAAASTVLLAWGLALLPAPWIAGSLTDRIGRLPMLAIASVAGAASMLALGLAATRMQLAVAAAALGFFGEMYRPPVAALITDVVDVNDRPRAFGLQFWAINLGFAVAATVGGLLAEINWFALFVGDAITTLVFGLLIVMNVEEPDRPASPPEASRFDSVRRVLVDRLFLAILGITTLTAMVYAQTQTTLSVFVVDRGLSPSDFGTAIALNGVVIVLLQPLAIGWVSRWSPGVAMAVGETVLAVGVGLTALASTWLGFAATVVVWTLGEIVTATFRTPVIADISPADMRGRYQGWYGFAFAVAFSVAPALGLIALAAIGAGLWWLCTAAGLIAAAAWFRLRRSIERRRRPASSTGIG